MEISASLLSVEKIDSTKLYLDLEMSKIDYFHIDVMDGQFVEKNTSDIMMSNTNSIALVTNTGIDVHLMVKDIDYYIEEYLPYNPQMISFHIEATKDENDTIRLINRIKSSGSKVGIAINPDTSIECIKPYLGLVHMILIMTVYPGMGGQTLIPETLKKAYDLKEYIKENNLDTKIEVDGGINDKTAKDAVDAGADILVIGSYLTSAENYSEAVKKIKTNDERGM